MMNRHHYHSRRETISGTIPRWSSYLHLVQLAPAPRIVHLLTPLCPLMIDHPQVQKYERIFLTVQAHQSDILNQFDPLNRLSASIPLRVLLNQKFLSLASRLGLSRLIARILILDQRSNLLILINWCFHCLFFPLTLFREPDYVPPGLYYRLRLHH